MEARKHEQTAATEVSAVQPAVALQNVTVAYRSYKERPTTIKESFLRLVRHGQLVHYSTFDALKNVSFTVPKGRVFALIGSNGSGKSTMLKVIAGVLKPTRGSVVTSGKISSLIELGAGFDPELNAVENIYLHCSLHGKTRAEIRERVPRILEFAELNDCATRPIKYFSSGMYARLGFSVAVDIDPEILLVDEVLGVGDERFQEKCLGVFHDFINRGKTIILVTHAMAFIEEMVQDAVLLSRGQVKFVGDTKTALQMYRDKSYETALDNQE